MKKENKFIEFLNSKGFYTALFTCLFAVLAIAAFVSIKNIDTITKLTTYGEKDDSLTDELRPAVIQTDTPVPIAELERSGRTNTAPAVPPGGTSPEGAKTRGNTSLEQSGQSRTEPPTAPDGVNKQDETNKESGQAGPKALNETPEEAKAAPKEEPKPEEKTDAQAQPQTKPEEAPKAEPQASVADGSEMSWPLDGAIVMSFSTEHAIYDKTLEQYRTNPTVSIGSEVGTQVKAAADGVVKSITIDPRMGHTLVIDHGNGWQTVYAQLQETILVKEGDSVKKGQAVGGVGAPTKYGILLGPHLVFGINKDDVPQNPSVVLAE